MWPPFWGNYCFHTRMTPFYSFRNLHVFFILFVTRTNASFQTFDPWKWWHIGPCLKYSPQKKLVQLTKNGTIWLRKACVAFDPSSKALSTPNFYSFQSNRMSKYSFVPIFKPDPNKYGCMILPPCTIPANAMWELAFLVSNSVRTLEWLQAFTW